jgi:hypothetical protein
MNSELASNIEPRTLTYVDWSRKPYPAILTTEDISALEASDCLFGRKFDIDKDSEILNRLDQTAALN